MRNNRDDLTLLHLGPPPISPGKAVQNWVQRMQAIEAREQYLAKQQAKAATLTRSPRAS